MRSGPGGSGFDLPLLARAGLFLTGSSWRAVTEAPDVGFAAADDSELGASVDGEHPARRVLTRPGAHRGLLARSCRQGDGARMKNRISSAGIAATSTKSLLTVRITVAVSASIRS